MSQAMGDIQLPTSRVIVTMVDSGEIKRVGIRILFNRRRRRMNDPDDMDFKPRTHLNGNRFSISSATSGKELASVEPTMSSWKRLKRATSRT